jgi:hypothetical protein
MQMPGDSDRTLVTVTSDERSAALVNNDESTLDVNSHVPESYKIEVSQAWGVCLLFEQHLGLEPVPLESVNVSPYIEQWFVPKLYDKQCKCSSCIGSNV